MSAPATAPATEVLGQSLRGLLAASRRLRGRETHRHDGRMSFAQYGLLFELAHQDELSSRELARHADLSPATVTQLLDALEADGLVARRRSEEDRRVVLTRLTPRGAEVVAARKAHIEPRFLAALEGFEDDELRTAAAVMARVGAFLDAMHDDDPA